MKIDSGAMGKTTTVTSHAAGQINSRNISVEQALKSGRIHRQHNGHTYIRYGKCEILDVTGSGDIRTAVIR